jgi:cellulose synthase (UDP-forming)
MPVIDPPSAEILTSTTTRSRSGVMPVTSSIVAATPHGPILPGRTAPERRTRRGTFVHALNVRQRILIGVLTAGWLISFVAFWLWWLQPGHLVGWFGLVVNSALLFYLAYLPTYLVIAVNRLRRVDPALPVPDLRVAFVVTRAPSEPWDVARPTLEAMLAQDYPHDFDVWLCDENPSAAIRQWCETHDVQVSSRYGIAEYHRSQWPRRTKCKEGNLAYFYDTVGYRDYDVVAQLDCDHVPKRTYLTEVVRPFGDPAIGYVAAPSMNDSNAAVSWSGRGRVYKEAFFHGAYQFGHNDGLAPVSIGSHYAVRTQALHTIGGLGPELAEDFSTSFLLTSAGWSGAFAPDAEAHGDGPLTFQAMATQEYQWSRSLVVLLIRTVPQHLSRLAPRLRFRFLFALTFYPLLAICTAGGLSLPAIAAVSGIAWVDVPYFQFLLRWGLIGCFTLAITILIKRWGFLRPRSAPVVSWEAALYGVARWPFIARGVVAAVVQQFRRKPVTFRVTPKVREGMEPLPTGLVLPFVGISAALSLAAIVGETITIANGYVLLCMLGALAYGTVSLAIPLLHAREAARAASSGFGAAVRATVSVPVVLAVVVWILLAVAIVPAPQYFAPVFEHGSIFQF